MGIGADCAKGYWRKRLLAKISGRIRPIGLDNPNSIILAGLLAGLLLLAGCVALPPRGNLVGIGTAVCPVLWEEWKDGGEVAIRLVPEMIEACRKAIEEAVQGSPPQGRRAL